MNERDPGTSKAELSPEVERIALPTLDSMTAEQLQIVEMLTNGPRKGVVGPFVPLIRCPRLLNLIEPLGAELRFRGQLDQRVKEIAICAVARHTSNQFEWDVHASLAFDSGVSRASLAAVLEERVPTQGPEDERIALEFTQCLMRTNLVSDSLFERTKANFGEAGIIELTTLIGYFVTVTFPPLAGHLT